MLKLARRARGHFVTLIEIRVHLIRVKPGHICRAEEESGRGLVVRNIRRPPEFAIPPPCSGPSARAVPTSGQRTSPRLQLSAAGWSSAVLASLVALFV